MKRLMVYVFDRNHIDQFDPSIGGWVTVEVNVSPVVGEAKVRYLNGRLRQTYEDNGVYADWSGVNL